MKDKAKQGRVNRRKGQDWERKVAKDMRELGFELAATTRSESKLLDDCLLDLCNLPFNIQLKNGYEKARPKYDKLFRDTKERIDAKIPKGHMLDKIREQPFLLIHKFGNSEEESTVTMTYSYFLELLKTIQNCKNIELVPKQEIDIIID